MVSKKEVEGGLDKVEEQFEVASENGLFKFAKNLDYFNKGLKSLESGRKALSENKIEEARSACLAAERILDEALENASRWWKFVFHHGVPLYLYLVLFLVAIGVAWNNGCIEKVWVVKTVPAWAPTLGVVGSILRGLWWLWFNVNRRRLRVVWAIWFVSAPFIGAILGLLTYLLYVAGFIAATRTIPTGVDPQFLPKVLATLGGFNWEWVVKLLNKLAGLES